MINTADIYESVLLTVSVTDRMFIDRLNQTIGEICLDCDINSINKLEEAPKAYKINDNLDIDERYKGAIIDNIIYMSTSKPDFKSEFIRKSKQANISVWNSKSKNRKIMRKDW